MRAKYIPTALALSALMAAAPVRAESPDVPLINGRYTNGVCKQELGKTEIGVGRQAIRKHRRLLWPTAEGFSEGCILERVRETAGVWRGVAKCSDTRRTYRFAWRIADDAREFVSRGKTYRWCRGLFD